MDSFVFYPNLLQIAETLTKDEDAIGRAMLAVVRYGTMAIDYEGDDSVISAVMLAARPLIDAAKGKRGKKRGGPSVGTVNNPFGRKGKPQDERVAEEITLNNSEITSEITFNNSKITSRNNSEITQSVQNTDTQSVGNNKNNLRENNFNNFSRANVNVNVNGDVNVDGDVDENVNGDSKKEGTIVPKKESRTAPRKNGDSLTLTFDVGAEKSRYEKFLDFLADECPYINTHLTLPTEAQFERLVNAYGSPMLAEVCRDLENSRDHRKKYVNLNRTVINWCKMRVAKSEQRQTITR